MKKIAEFLKPYLAIVLGALLLLNYLNWLTLGDELLATGIIAIILAGYYLCVGVFGVIFAEKIKAKVKKIFDLISIAVFALFMFIVFLLFTINFADIMGPTGWTITILSMVAALAFALIYLLANLTNIALLKKLDYLFAAIFVLALLLNVLFDVVGDPISLGNISVIGVIIYLIYAYMLFNSFEKPKEIIVEEAVIDDIEEKEEVDSNEEQQE